MKPSDRTPSSERVINDFLEPGSPITSNDQEARYSDHTRRHSYGLVIDREAAWTKVSARIDSGKQKQKSSASFLYKIAASLVIIVVAAISYFSLSDQFSGPVVFETLAEGRSLTLEDGTEVTLNKNSRLYYHKGSDEDNRVVNLEGEALFAVTKNPDKPVFKVLTRDGDITVLGTQFNVNTIKGTRVYVKEGSVAITARDQNEKIKLQKGDLGSISIAGNMKVSKGTDNLLFWKTGVMYFNDQSLEEIVKTINKNLGSQIVVTGGIGSCHVTLSFEGHAVEDFLEELEKIKEVQIEKSGNSILIDGEGC